MVFEPKYSMSLLIKIKKRQALESKLAKAQAKVKVHWNEDESPSCPFCSTICSWRR